MAAKKSATKTAKATKNTSQESQDVTEGAANLHLTIEEGKFTSYEKARMIGSRALQIAQGAAPLIKISKKDMEAIGFNPIEIAKREFESGSIPISVKRALPHEGNPHEGN